VKKSQPIYIVADDLTGAADAANYFRTEKHRVRVSFLPATPWMFSLDESVIQVFDSESRSLDLPEAMQRLNNAAKQLLHSGPPSFSVYKKVDSTMRGHIGGEIEALLHGLGRRLAVLAPAFPVNGRIIRNGELLVKGVPVSQTAFAKDPHNPVMFDKVIDIVRQTTTLPLVALSHSLVLEGVHAISQFLERIQYTEAIVVVDAETDADLAMIARAIASNPVVIPCGSAGLARQLATNWCQAEPAEKFDSRKRLVCDRILLTVGSANPVSHSQLVHATTALGIPTVVLQPALLAEPPTHSHEIVRAEWAIEQPVTQVVAATLEKERAVRNPNLEGSFESDLAAVASHWSKQALTNELTATGFIATGGDTALALCKALSVKAIWPEGEVLSGMPWSRMETESGEFLLVSKAGGFGQPDALEQAIAFLKN